MVVGGELKRMGQIGKEKFTGEIENTHKISV